MITKKGFTLIELLVVIGILAVLATATALILNPAELLKQSRDSTRVADLATLSSAIDLYISDQGGATNFSLGACADTTTGRAYAVPTNGSFVGTGAGAAVAVRLVDGTGWVDINFNNYSAGLPFTRLPIDPTNTGNLVYRYACDATGTAGKYYEINAAFESVKFTQSTGTNLAGTDGGDTNTTCTTLPMVTTNATGCAYEVGNKLTL